MDEALALWSHGHDSEAPTGVGACRQKSWDCLSVGAVAERLRDEALDEANRARLLAAATESQVHGFMLCRYHLSA